MLLIIFYAIWKWGIGIETEVDFTLVDAIWFTYFPAIVIYLIFFSNSNAKTLMNLICFLFFYITALLVLILLPFITKFHSKYSCSFRCLNERVRQRDGKQYDEKIQITMPFVWMVHSINWIANVYANTKLLNHFTCIFGVTSSKILNISLLNDNFCTKFILKLSLKELNIGIF